MTGRLSGKVAVVTGAASGIGQAIARGFVLEGARVGFLDRTLPALPDPGPGSTGEAFSLVADITDELQIVNAFGAVKEMAGGLDVLVHCAAVQMFGSDAAAAQLDKAVWDRTIDVNLTGAFLVCRYGIELILATGRGGSIVNCGSPTALRGSSPDFAAYSSSKGGVHALTRVLAAEYGRRGIRANTLVPGPTETTLTADAFRDPDLRRRLTDRVSLGRLGLAQDYVGVAVFLASDESGFATGAEFVVDGGYTIS